uniref:Uncharacterized protein n=1 Tax=Setaria viridis TaxID=4556 RepID=A0A4U6VLL0_SETVI|nr:hypothetical protein SEVIR_3G333050v2 [Setaria viridis]
MENKLQRTGARLAYYSVFCGAHSQFYGNLSTPRSVYKVLSATYKKFA